MAFIQCDFYSEILGTRTSLNAVIPSRDESGQEPPREMPEQYPVLFLLHGLHSNYSAWSRYSSVERYANEKGLAVVMPDAGRSFYTNMRYGYRYFDFFSQELPEVANRLFPLSRDRSQRFIAGLSMGGYGTWDAIQRRPDLFAAAVPICGGGDKTLGKEIAKLPIWAWHGDKDNVIKASRSRDMIEAIKAAGGSPKYSEIKNRGHNSWVDVWNSNELWDWLYSQKRK